MRLLLSIFTVTLVLLSGQVTADEETTEEAVTLLANRDVRITFLSGETIGPFFVTWNYGYREFQNAYETFLKDGTQDKYQFRMHPDPKGPEVTILVDFKNVAAVSSVVRLTDSPRF